MDLLVLIIWVKITFWTFDIIVKPIKWNKNTPTELLEESEWGGRNIRGKSKGKRKTVSKGEIGNLWRKMDRKW